MKFILTPDQRHFFSENGYIEFEELLSEEKCQKLEKLCDNTIAKRLETDLDKLHNKAPFELFMAGRDLFRDDNIIKKVATNSDFAGIASILFNENPLRLTYDQYIRGSAFEKVPLSEHPTLQEISCYKPILGGLILRLTNTTLAPSFDDFTPFPDAIGSGVFFTADQPLYLDPLFQAQDQRFLLITYSPRYTLYIDEPNDPHNFAQKKEGYVFNEPLKDHSHPLLR